MAELNLRKLLEVSHDLFSTDRQIELLAHAALAFCHIVEGKTLGFSTQTITDGVNRLFPSKDSYLQDHNVKRFISRSTIHPADRTLIPKIGAFIIHECIANDTIASSRVIVACLSWWNFVEEAKHKLGLYTPEDELKRVRDRHFDSIIEGLRHVTQRPKAADIYFHFFGAECETDREDSEYSETCYFLSYRYSLTPGKMIKTFLLVSTPACNGRGVFEYHHVHQHDEVLTRGAHRETLRAARGIVVGIDKNYYFLGGSVRRNILNRWPVYAEGIQVIVMEKEQFRHQAPGLIALYLTNNNEMRPMIGRSAVLPLGNAADIGKQEYQKFNLGVFDQNELDEVVSADLGLVDGLRIDKADAARFIGDVVNLKHIDLQGAANSDLIDLIKWPIVADSHKAK